ncbi:MaoC family dehydratase [Haloparvum sp. PAK95]|uniref:MaoC family dehydratase n=1 Tax=Haloparvum sp. PAK95 TaxID=3418962 RepID=UPI003D2F05C0
MPVASVGDESRAETVLSAEDVDAFAEITGDDNPIHLDEAYAGETMFGGRIAHGILSAGVISAAMADLPGDVIYLSQDLRFENPVQLGDRVVATATVEEEPGGDRIRVETVARVPDRDEVAISGEATALSTPHED